MKKYKKDINFNIFVSYKMLFSKMLSCVVVFFILISLINVRGIGIDVDLYMTAFSVEILTRMFVVGINEGEGIIDKRARVGVEDIIALELEEIANRQGEGRGSNRGERTGEGNSLMASVGYLMAGDIYEKDRAIKEEDSDNFICETGIIKRWEEVEYKCDIKHVRNSIVMGEIIKEKEGDLLLAKELSNIDLCNNNGIKEEGIKNKKIKRSSVY